MCIFQSEQVIKLRFWLNNNLASLIFKSSDLNPLDYHVGCDTKTLYTPKPTNIAELKTALLLMWNDLPQECTDKAVLSFRKRLRFCVAAAGIYTMNTQFKYQDGSWHSLLKCLKCLRKSCVKFDSLLSKTYWIFKTRLHVQWKSEH